MQGIYLKHYLQVQFKTEIMQNLFQIVQSFCIYKQLLFIPLVPYCVYMYILLLSILSLC